MLTVEFLPHEVIKAHAIEVIKRAKFLSENWTGTIIGKTLDYRIKSVEDALYADEDYRAQYEIYYLESICHNAEEENV